MWWAPKPVPVDEVRGIIEYLPTSFNAFKIFISVILIHNPYLRETKFITLLNICLPKVYECLASVIFISVYFSCGILYSGTKAIKENRKNIFIMQMHKQAFLYEWNIKHLACLLHIYTLLSMFNSFVNTQ